jgi:hypothetical protein
VFRFAVVRSTSRSARAVRPGSRRAARQSFHLRANRKHFSLLAPGISSHQDAPTKQSRCVAVLGLV